MLTNYENDQKWTEKSDKLSIILNLIHLFVEVFIIIWSMLVCTEWNSPLTIASQQFFICIAQNPDNNLYLRALQSGQMQNPLPLDPPLGWRRNFTHICLSVRRITQTIRSDSRATIFFKEFFTLWDRAKQVFLFFNENAYKKKSEVIGGMCSPSAFNFVTPIIEVTFDLTCLSYCRKWIWLAWFSPQ